VPDLSSSRLPLRVEAMIPGAADPFPSGNLGDGNIHYNVSQPVGADPAPSFLARWDKVQPMRSLPSWGKLGGSISAEHGIGVMKRELAAGGQRSRRVRAHARLSSKLLDPNGILNPGKSTLGGGQKTSQNKDVSEQRRLSLVLLGPFSLASQMRLPPAMVPRLALRRIKKAPANH